MRSGHFFRGVLLITAGVLLLMTNLGYVPAHFWWQLIQLWPVLLIAFGLRLVGKDSWTMNLAVLILIGATVGYAVWATNTDAEIGPKNTARFNQAINQQISEVDMTVNFGDGNLEIREGSNELVRAALDYYREQPNWSFVTEGNKGTLVVTQEELRGSTISIPAIRRSTREWDIVLHPNPTWTIKLNAGACSLDADFRGIKVKDLQVNTGASDMKIRMGSQETDGRVIVKAGASNIQLSFPQEAGIEVAMTGALSSNNLTEVGFVKSGEFYYSPNYEDAEYFYSVDISVGVSNIMILLD